MHLVASTGVVSALSIPDRVRILSSVQFGPTEVCSLMPPHRWLDVRVAERVGNDLASGTVPRGHECMLGNALDNGHSVRLSDRKGAGRSRRAAGIGINPARRISPDRDRRLYSRASIRTLSASSSVASFNQMPAVAFFVTTF
jgi:hypothetical protein